MTQTVKEIYSTRDKGDLPPLPREVPAFYAGVVLWGRSGSLLLQLRDNIPGIANPGQIGTFGGGAEAGETPEEAAIREIKEELNIDLQPTQLIHLLNFYRTFQGPTTLKIYCFGALDIEEDSVACSEGQLVRIDPEALDAVENMTEACLVSARHLIAHVKEKGSNHD